MNSINVRRVNNYWFFPVIIRSFEVTNLLLNSIKLMVKRKRNHEHS